MKCVECGKKPSFAWVFVGTDGKISCEHCFQIEDTEKTVLEATRASERELVLQEIENKINNLPITLKKLRERLIKDLLK